jgi:hypothetical protein
MVWGQYKADAAGPAPSELQTAVSGLLAGSGFLITNNGAKYCEIWLRAARPAGGTVYEENVTLPEIPAGAFLGVIRFDVSGADGRGQTIAPGLYLLRYAVMPGNESHQGAARQRDFLVLTPAAEDRKPEAIAKLDALLALSRKVSGTGHPAVLSFWKAETDAPGFFAQGDDWVLEADLGDTPVAIMVASGSGK